MNQTPTKMDAAAKLNGVALMDRLRALRSTFGLSLSAAKAIADATDGKLPDFPEVVDASQLTKVLGAELGYCSCASGNAITVLRELLRVAQERSDATGDEAAFARASRRLESLLENGGGWAEWLVYGLEQRDFVWHGFRQVDLWITDKGRKLLQAIEQFELRTPPPEKS